MATPSPFSGSHPFRKTPASPFTADTGHKEKGRNVLPMPHGQPVLEALLGEAKAKGIIADMKTPDCILCAHMQPTNNYLGPNTLALVDRATGTLKQILNSCAWTDWANSLEKETEVYINRSHAHSLGSAATDAKGNNELQFELLTDGAGRDVQLKKKRKLAEELQTEKAKVKAAATHSGIVMAAKNISTSTSDTSHWC